MRIVYSVLAIPLILVAGLNLGRGQWAVALVCGVVGAGWLIRAVLYQGGTNG